MKTTLRYLSLNAQATWHGQVEKQLQPVLSLAAITAAEVVFEHQREAKPALRVQVQPEAPGPRRHAEGRDNTLESGTKPSVHEGAPDGHPGQSMATGRVEPEDLARFEGEGGLEAHEAAAPHPEELSGQ